MRVHLDVLGWLYILSGAFGVLTGTSLGVLAIGTGAALSNAPMAAPSAPATVWLLAIAAALLAVGGALMLAVGRSVVRRSQLGRRGALLLAIPNLLVVPFGTALGIYTFWTLLNDEARLEFGRPPRAPA